MHDDHDHESSVLVEQRSVDLGDLVARDCDVMTPNCIEDMPCHKRIVGSTTNPTNRWSTHKSSCNSEKSNSTGLSKHFKLGLS